MVKLMTNALGEVNQALKFVIDIPHGEESRDFWFMRVDNIRRDVENFLNTINNPKSRGVKK